MPSEGRSESAPHSIAEGPRPRSSARKHHRDGVVAEPQLKRETHKTMGYARVPLNPPSDFLKAHSLSARKLEPRVSSRGPLSPKCKLEKRRPPVPTRNEIFQKEKEEATIAREEKNFRRMNKLELQQLTPKQHAHKVIDSRDGHVQIADRSGLEPVYLFKKNFGKNPAYIREIKNHASERKDQSIEENSRDKPAMHLVTEEERQKLLTGLKQNWAELQREFQMLPMLIDTVPKKRHKTKLENQLRELEKDIDLLERNPIIYVSQEPNGKLTASTLSKYSGS